MRSSKPNSIALNVLETAKKNMVGKEESLNNLPQRPEKHTYKLQDLIDIEQFQMLQDRLNEIYSFPSAIIDNDGNILTATAWQDICTKFHRQNRECEKECIKSDAYIRDHLHEANPSVSYRCPHGLVDNATPIIINGVHYGNFFTGQFFLEKPDLEFFREQAKRYGFNEESYLDAVRRVPIWSRKQLDSYLFFIKGLIEVISSTGLEKLKEIEHRKVIEANEERASAILSQMLDGFWMVHVEDGRIIDVNRAMCQMLGYTREEMLMLTVADIEANDSVDDVQRRMQEIMRDGSAHFESRFRRKDGTIIDVEVSVSYLPQNEFFFGFHRDITSRKAATAALAHSHDLMRYIIEHNRNAIAIHDKDMRYIYVSQRYLDDYKIMDRDVIGKHHYEVLPDIPQKWRDVHQRVLNGEILSRDDDSYPRDDGTLEWTRWECRPWYENDGSIGGLIVYTEVITDRKRSEEALHNVKTRLETLINVSPLAIVMLNKEENIELWNSAAEKMFGWSASEVLGKPNPLISADMQDEYARIRSEILSGRSVINMEAVRQRKDGSRINVSISSSSVNDISGKLVGRMAIITDITEQKRAEDALVKSEKHYRSLFENAPIGILTIDPLGNILEVNPRALAILGSPSADSTKSINFLTFTPLKETGVSAAAIRCFETGEVISAETAYTSKWEKKIYLAYQMTPIYDEQNHIYLIQLIIEDITERKNREKELQSIAALSAALRTAPSRVEMLPVIVEQAIKLMDCDAISIEIIDPLTGDVIVEEARGVWDKLKGTRQKRGTGINAIITQSLQPYYSPDLQNDPSPFFNEWARSGLLGCTGVPLLAQGYLLGFIWAGKKSDMTPNEVKLLSALADIAANAIHRTTLHEQTQKDAADLAQAYDTTLEGWALALELRDQETEGHTRRVVEQTVELARRMGVKAPDLENIRRGALLHDIGKMGIPDSILLKRGSLDEREWETMRLHPEYAYKLLERIEYLRPALDIPYYHHEKWDGSGYPRGLKGMEIPLPARIFAVIDVWDALTSDRPYRPAWSRENAYKYIRQQNGTHFDPQVVGAFIAMVSDSY